MLRVCGYQWMICAFFQANDKSADNEAADDISPLRDCVSKLVFWLKFVFWFTYFLDYYKKPKVFI